MKTSLPSFAQYRWAARLDSGAGDGGRRCRSGSAGAWGASASERRAAATATGGAEEDTTPGDGRRRHGSNRCKGSEEDDN